MLGWGGNVAEGDKDRIHRIVNEAGRIIGSRQQSFQTAYDGLVITKLKNVLDDVTHPLHDVTHSIHDRLAGQLNIQSGRMRLPTAVTGRYLSSFIPQAIKIQNSIMHRRGAIVIDL